MLIELLPLLAMVFLNVASKLIITDLVAFLVLSVVG